LPRQSDKSDGLSTLPTPELNPLLNPVLGQNMGRWAEVYFTSPPEKREQAVIELLRELQGENSTAEETVNGSPSSVKARASELVVASASQIVETQPAEDQQMLVRCHVCGRENPASHRFCGMCGRPVTEKKAADPPVSGLNIADLHVEDPSQDELAAPAHSQESSRGAFYEPTLRTNELSLFQSSRDFDYRDDSTDEIFHYPPASRSYRVYVGMALLIVLFALGYMAWRSTQATSQSAHVESQAPPAVTTEPVTTEPAAPAPAAPSAAPTDTPDRTASANQPAATAEANPESAKPPARTSGHKAVKAAPPTTPSSERKSQAGSAPGSGAEELATAQGYLSGTEGQQRNRTEAAKWLWKAVAKHNADATLLLADLYLKGQGVGKNCDQARILLDAAARKGMKDAGERLRHLQAFGCD
jgi:hypothetical protein